MRAFRSILLALAICLTPVTADAKKAAVPAASSPASPEVEPAIGIMVKVCAAINGTLADHQNIQNALKILVDAARKNVPPPKAEVPETPAPAPKKS